MDEANEKMTVDSVLVYFRKKFTTWDEASAIQDAAKVLGLHAGLYAAGTCRLVGVDDAEDFTSFKDELELRFRSKEGGEVKYIASKEHRMKPEIVPVTDGDGEPGFFYAEIEVGTHE